MVSQNYPSTHEKRLRLDSHSKLGYLSRNKGSTTARRQRDDCRALGRRTKTPDHFTSRALNCGVLVNHILLVNHCCLWVVPSL